ncbi:YbgC/FadM family acyl-CoA thioesterase [Candidatus Pelagibacter sp.]|jgi:acyl-CoA thioester hydrolase|uniref:YbgC/FadM family acyl-CoA thioesterase n=1 Tax=uncultured Candidatus Pelagibacter sp. TaxID=372654 RepID=UPI002333900B|nr:YbgC/FadM family acyl-CoA thioesterase [uncultured Candidatus Pelagibacter sp.]MDB4811642.1 YbgC/FadM family acyl-CoA thioesterase [Candidatus Pelagibacter sp.]MDC0404956.1 YbgC/FadM family acyl-CoA thioesterase [Candidatus Pelagibacter sp.]MDC0862255.1 YbgC/FadM family acyl-CoA thioesterase [bacterium]MDC1077733.1 YbgC/FadM family acyl-CoA thioesterase [Candidatus Pelagibacter sp.]
MHENFYHNVKVYYEDTDAGGVVYYANYLKYLERARTEALSTIGLSNIQIKEKFGALIIVKSCNIEYKKSAQLEDELKIRSFVKSVTKTSFFMNQIITNGDSVIVEAQVHLVFVNAKSKPVKVPEIIFDNFKPYFCDTIKL